MRLADAQIPENKRHRKPLWLDQKLAVAESQLSTMSTSETDGANDERPEPTNCILCGALLRPPARGLFAELFTARSIKCTSGHKALYYFGDNRWYTEHDDVAQRLKAKGFKVMSAPGVTWFRTRHFIEK